jgi:uncharacterized membrane protein YGL010W
MNSLREYASVHQHWGNIAIHIISVPFFMAAVLIGLLRLASGNWMGVVISIVIAGMAISLQGIGHQLETRSPPPFDGPLDFIKRIFAEQFYRFWIFLVMKIQGLL